MPQLTVNTGMKTDGVVRGVSDIKAAMESLQSSITKINTAIAESVGKYIQIFSSTSGAADTATQEMNAATQSAESFKTETSQIETAAKKLAREVDSLNIKIQKALGDNNARLAERLRADLADAAREGAALGARMEALAGVTVEADEYTQLVKAIQAAEKEYKEYSNYTYAEEAKQKKLRDKAIQEAKDAYANSMSWGLPFGDDNGLSEADEIRQAIEDFEDTNEWKNLQWDLEHVKELKQALDELVARKKELESTEGTFTIGAGMDEYQQAFQRLQDVNKAEEEAQKPQFLRSWEKMTTISGILKAKFEELQQAANTAGYAMQHPIEALDRVLPVVISGIATLARSALNLAISFGRMVASNIHSIIRSIASSAMNAASGLAKMVASGAVSFLTRLAVAAKNAAVHIGKVAGSAIVGGLKKMGSALAFATKSMLGLGKSARRSNGGIQEAIKLIVRYGFGVRSAYMLVRRLRSAVVDAFQNMAKKVPEVNKALSALSSSMDLLKNSSATAFQPILTAIAPYLVQLMDMMSEAAAKVGEFFAVLTGQNYIYKATKANIDYAKSLDKSTKSTKKNNKETENQLASFDHLNILKENKDTSSDSDKDETPTSDFKKVPIESAISDLAKRIKDAFNNGDFTEIGKILANKLTELVNKVDWDGLGKKIGEWINHIVDVVNGFFDNFDWVDLGQKFAEGLNSLIDNVNFYELGRAMTQKLRALIEMAWGVVSDINWEKVGEAIGNFIQGAFDNIPWEMLADLLAKAINSVFTAIYVAADGFDWVGAGIRIANALRHMIESIDITKIYNALSTVFKGILDFVTPILEDERTWKKIGKDFGTFLNKFFRDQEMWDKVGRALKGGLKSALKMLGEFVITFEWGENGKLFGEQLKKLVNDFPDDLGQTLSDLLAGALLFMGEAFGDVEIFNNLAQKMATWLTDILTNEEMWINLGTLVNNLLLGILSFGDKFMTEFEAKAPQIAENIKKALSKIQWGEIASSTWNLIKKAFSATGSFLDALFSESASLDPEVIKNRNGDSFYGKIFEDERNAVSAFNAQSLATKIGTKISEALSKIPWESIGTTMWDAAKKAFNGVKDFIVALFGITEDDVSATKSKSEVEAIGIKIGNAISRIPWQEIFETAAGEILVFFQGAWNGLIGQESDSPGNGTVFAILAASFVLLKGGLVKAVAGLTGTVIGAVSTNIPLVAGALAAFYDYTKIKEGVVGYSEAGEAYNAVVQKNADTYIGILKTSGKEAADAFAASAVQIDTSAMSVDQAVQAIIDKTKADWGDAPKDWKEGLSQGWNTYFGEGGSGIVGLVNDGVNGLLETLGLRKPEVTDAMTETYTIPFAPLSEQTNQDTANLGTGGADSLISALDSKKEEVAQKYDETYLPSPEELVEWGYLDAQMVADSGIDGTVDELTTRKGEVEKAYDDTFVKTYESKVEREGFKINGGSKSRLATLGEKNAKGYASGLDSENGTIKKSHDKILKTSETGWGNVEKDQAEKLVAMDKKTSEIMGNMTTTSETETASQAKPVYDNYGEIMVAVDECMRAARDYLVQYAGEMTTAMNDEMDVMGGIDWTPVGGNIISGIAQGIYNGWRWLTDTVWNLARSLFDTACSALGINSPSRVFREGIGTNIGLGIAEGILDSEPDVLDSVTDLADASANALSDATLDGNYGVGEIGLVDGLDGVLGNFADRVQSSFSNLLSSLNAIAENVAFRTPTIATGAVLPYGVTGQSGGSKPISDIITETNDDQTMAVIQAFNQQTIAIVQAIERYSTTNINIDKKSLTDSIIEEINRRTRAQGKSPLLN